MHRTMLVTAAAITGVVLASGAALATNMGLLSAADDSPVGQLSASTGVTATEPRRIDVYLDDTTPAVIAIPTTDTGGGESESHEYVVADAGVVSLIRSGEGIRLGDVSVDSGWAWNLGQPNGSVLTVTLTNGTRTLVFTATADASGTISASVDEPITVPAATGPRPGDQGSVVTTSVDADHEDHGHDDHEDDGHDKEEHEGSEDDD